MKKRSFFKHHQPLIPEKIAMLGSMPPIRGVSSYCLEFALAMADLASVEFISFKKIYPAFLYPGGVLNDDKTFPDIRHPRLNVRRRLTWYNPVSWLIEGLFTDAELLHAQWWSLPLAPVYAVVCIGFRIRRKPVVLTVHNVQSHERTFLYNLVSRLLFKLSDHFIVHSTVNLNQLIENYHIHPVQVTRIPHGPLDFHVKCNQEKNLIHQQMELPLQAKVILFFGAIRSYKGIATAIKAFFKVVNWIQDVYFLIAGKLWESWIPYQQLISELGLGKKIRTHLKYIPSEDVSDFFVVSDLVILPYHYFDSQSGVGATALSFRKPLIVTNVGGLPDLVEDKRCVVPPEDPDALADAIITCLEDPELLAKLSVDSGGVAEKMAWPEITKKTWFVYKQILGLKEPFNRDQI